MVPETVSIDKDSAAYGEDRVTDGQPASPQTEIDLFDVAALLVREKKTIFKFAVVFLLLTAAAVYLVLKPMYRAEAVFLPPQHAPGSSMTQIASQLGSLGAVGALAGVKNPGDIYLGILASRTVAASIVDKFHLQDAYKVKKISAAEKKLWKRSTFASEKTGLIRISVEDHDAKRAANLANGFLEALQEQNGRLALTESSQRRLFFEQQLEREKNALADAEVDLKKTQEATGLIIPGGQAQMQIEEMTQLRAQIASQQVELAALRQGATDQNPQVVRLQSQIAGLEQQLSRLQNSTAQRQPGSIELPTSKVPELSLEYLRKQRELKYHEVLFELIAKQYESARMDESRDAPVLQTVDRAVAPEEPAGLPRPLVVALGGVVGVLFGVAWVILRRATTRLMRNRKTRVAAPSSL